MLIVQPDCISAHMLGAQAEGSFQSLHLNLVEKSTPA